MNCTVIDAVQANKVPLYSSNARCIPKQKGKLTTVTSTVSATEYRLFDNLGRMTRMAQITDGQTYTSKYTYNFSGALIEEEYPSGRKVKNEFEADGDLRRVGRTLKASDHISGILDNLRPLHEICLLTRPLYLWQDTLLGFRPDAL